MTDLSFDACQELILREVDHAVRGLVRRLHLRPGDREDIRQDLLADLLRRLPDFDPARASLATFVALVVGHRAALLARCYRRERLLFGHVPVSIDEPLIDDDGRPTTLAASVPEEAGYSASLGNPCDRFSEVEQRHDVRAVLRGLPQDLREVCLLLASTTPTAASRAGGASRSGLYRRIRELRFRFRAAGLDCPA